MSRELESAEIVQLLALFKAGRHVELESRTRQLLEHYPESGFIWKALGASLRVQGKQAIPSLQKAAELLPGDPEAHSNLGVALRELGRRDEALASYRRALAIIPDYTEAHINQGNCLRELGQLDEALMSCRRALAVKPDFGEAHCSQGNALQDLRKLDEALASYRRALAIKPDYAEAHSNLGNALQDLRKLDEALASYRRALAIKPDYAEAHSNLGSALQDLRQFEGALASYRRALSIKPNYAEAHSNLGSGLEELGLLDDALTGYRRALMIKPDLSKTHSNLLFIQNYQPDEPPEMLLMEARRFGVLTARQARPYTIWSNTSEPGRCLRVGLVSGDLCRHPVGYFVEGILTALSANTIGRLEVIAYLSYARLDTVAERIKACCHGWHSVAGLSDERLARQIREDGIDILIDLSGHTEHNRLPMFAWKPAPVQVSWLGYFATTGVAAMDYLIADPWTLPETEEAQFTEKIWRLPETRLCFTPPDVEVPVATLPALDNGYITFGCFNNLSKINAAVVALWAQVLQTVPESRLYLKTKQLEEDPVRQRIRERFAAHGIVSERLILEGHEPRAEYLSAYGRVDIALDSFPFPGGATTVESLWMGVPVLTLTGKHFLSRQGMGLLMNVGLSDWIATDAADYLARVVAHAGNLQHLADLRKRLRQQLLASPLTDAPRFALHFEEALRGMWARWCAQQREQSNITRCLPCQELKP